MRKKLYAFLACVLIIGTIILCATRSIHIESDFFSLIPDEENSEQKQEIYSAIAADTASVVNVLAEASNADDAVNALRGIREKISFDDFDKYEIPDAENAIKFLAPYRFQLLSERHRELFRAGNSDEIIEEALAAIYSPVSSVISPALDPYGFSTDFLLGNELLKSSFSPTSDGILTREYDGKFYAYLPLRLRGDALNSLLSLQEKVGKLVKTVESENLPNGCSIRLTGVPVHTYFSSSASIREINILTIISLAILLGIFLFVFRSLKTFLLGAVAIALSAGTAFLVCNALFGGIHTLVLVFGVSLMGISVDYILHFLVSGGENTSIPSPQLKRALAMSAATTCLGFSVFFLSGVPLLAQMALFSIAGILCMLAIVLFVFPKILRKTIFVDPRALRVSEKISAAFSYLQNILVKLPAVAKIAVIVVCAGATIFCATIPASDKGSDLRSFYTPPQNLAEAEKTFSRVAGGQNSAVFFAVVGSSEQEALSRTEKFVSAWREKKFGTCTAITQIVPAAETQDENRKFADSLLDRDDDFPIKIPKEKRPPNKCLTPSALSENPAFASLNILFRKCGDEYFSIIRPREIPGGIDVRTAFLETEKSANLPAGTVLYMDKIGEISGQLSTLRTRAAIMLCIAFLSIFILFCIRHGTKIASKMILPSLAAVAGTIVILYLLGEAISLFHVLAFFLILGFGADYVIHRVENGNAKASLSIMLSCMTTIASFGMLAWTQFPITRSIGICVFAGIMLSYILSAFVTTPRRLPRR